MSKGVNSVVRIFISIITIIVVAVLFFPSGVSAKADGVLPTSIDLSTDDYYSRFFPQIGYQSGGSCASWATTYYQFTFEVAKLKNWNAKSTSNH